jgi:hypothetical protein
VNTPNEHERLHINWRVVGRAALSGLVLIIPIVVITEILDATIDNFGSSHWLVLPFILILFAYAAAGYAGARLEPTAPFTHGMLAAIGSFAAWLVIRVLARVVRGANIGFGLQAVFANALFAAGLGLFGAVVAGRAPELLHENESPPPRRPQPRPNDGPDAAAQ